MNRNKPSKQPRPSYEEGKLRDPSIEKMQDKDFTRDDFLRVIERAAKTEQSSTATKSARSSAAVT